jgi:hypothetical protein
MLRETEGQKGVGGVLGSHGSVLLTLKWVKLNLRKITMEILKMASDLGVVLLVTAIALAPRAIDAYLSIRRGE